MSKYLNGDKKIIKIDIERLSSLVINLAQYLKKGFLIGKTRNFRI